MLENKTLKRIVAGLLALSIVTGASPVQKGIGGKTRCVAIASDTEGANAPYWDADTQTLHLSGSNWTKNEDVILNYKEQAINIVAEEGTVLPKDCMGLFQDCSKVETIDLSKADSSNVVNAKNMFCKCYYLTSLELGDFDTSNITNMDSMFKSCQLLTYLDLSYFDTSSVEDMTAMFKDCKKLSSIDLTSFDTSNVKSMSNMFYNCASLSQLHLGAFELSSVENMNHMFYGCNNLKTIKVSELWNAENVDNSNEMFGGCNNIVGGEGTTYDPQHIDGEYARVDADEEPGYLTTTVYYEMVDAKEPTCTEDGNIKYYMEPDGCLFTNRKGTRLSDRNGDGYVDLNDTVIPKTGHSFGEPIVSNNADGSISAIFTCEKCGDTKEVILSADEITALLENAYLATVTWNWTEDYGAASVSISDIPVRLLS